MQGNHCECPSLRRIRRLHLFIFQCGGAASCQSCHSPSVSCFLVDESGYVVVSTVSGEYRGKFFGSLHGEVMEALIEQEIFQRSVAVAASFAGL